jgi:hypothetical protein
MRPDTDATRIRAVILTTQRTGSTFLVECLGSHPQIDCAGEILIGEPEKPQPGYRGRFLPLYKLLNIARSGAWRPGNRMGSFFAGGQAKVRAFKVMYNHLANPFALRYLRQHEEVRILHLRRQNLLKVHVSSLLLLKRMHVSQARKPVEAVWLHVDPVVAIESMRKARLFYEHFDKLFERHQRLPLTYEGLIDSQFLQADTGERICDFLGVVHHPMKSRIVKLNPESLQDMVTNYDELSQAISRTEFADMLE